MKQIRMAEIAMTDTSDPQFVGHGENILAAGICH
jgi:hypothetical protein